MQPLRSSSITEPSSLLRAAPPLCPASVLLSSWGPPIWTSPFASGRQVPTFHARARFRVTPPSCRMPSGPQSGHPPDLSRVNDFPPVSTSSIRIRHVIIGLLALHSLTHPCRVRVPPFPQRSPPRLLTVAACGGLGPAPDSRRRGTYPHLLHSIAPPFASAFVAHSHPRIARTH